MALSSVEEALEDIRQGKFLIVVDDEKRENEGDLVMAAEAMTPDAVNFMVTEARGLLCMPVLGERLDQLNMPLMVDGHNSARHGTAFTVSVDYNVGTTTGISAADRAKTILAMIDPDAKPEDFARPGHIFPLRYHDGGVLARPGHTESIIDLARIAGMYPSGVVCEIMNPDGTMSRMPELERFSEIHGIKIITIAQIIAYRRRHERLIEKIAEARLPTAYGEFEVKSYTSPIEPGEHVALVLGEWEPGEPISVRIHSECLTGDVLGSIRCDCGDQRKLALEIIGQEGKGVFLYMRQEGRGIGLHNKIKAYFLQDTGWDTVEANEMLGFESDHRHYGVAAQILRDLNVKQIRLLTNNPRKIVGLLGYDFEIVEQRPIETEVNEENRYYKRTKRNKLGHTLWHC